LIVFLIMIEMRPHGVERRAAWVFSIGCGERAPAPSSIAITITSSGREPEI
jgi:hypothetical protein